MRNAIAAGLIAAATAVSFAQPSPATQTTSPKPITVTGCLGSNSNQDTFTLTTSVPAIQPEGVVGTSGSMEPMPLTKKPDTRTVIYTLEPIAPVDLRPHVGHTVQITGVEPPAESQVTTAASEKSTAPPPAAGQPSPQVQTTAKADILSKRLTVSAVKQLANDCRIER